MSRRDDDTPITLAGILEMEPGTQDSPVWINQPFSAEIAEVKQRQTKTGAVMFTGGFLDPDTGATIGFTAFGRKAFPPVGTFVQVSGNGISLSEYNGNPQVTIGQKAVVQTIGAAPARQAPPQRQQQAPARQAAPAGQRPASSAAPLGVTVGMAINNAVNAVTGYNESQFATEGSITVPGTLEWSTLVWDVASDILRMAKAFEAGKIAPSARDRGQPAQQPEEPAQEEPQAQQAEDYVDPDTMPGDPQPEPQQQRPAARQQPPARQWAQPARQPAQRPKPGPDGSVSTEGVTDRVPF